MSKSYVPWTQLKVSDIMFSLGLDRQNKTTINMMLSPNCTQVAMVTPACVTNWPRVTGDGNYGTMWGPSDVTKAKYTLDLTDGTINGEENLKFVSFNETLDAIDEKLLDFVHNNQLKILGRKNLSREEVAILQFRSVRPKYDKLSGQQVGKSIQLSTTKFAFDGMGGKYERFIGVCDPNGNIITGGNVTPGDVVAATIYANLVYCGVGGDKFGIHWGFEDVSVICQRSKLDIKHQVPVFATQQYDFTQEYCHADTVREFSNV